MFEIKVATKYQTKQRVALLGPAGSGKTLGALTLAGGLASGWDKVVVVDTERGTSHFYAHLGPFGVIELGPPYSVPRYLAAIDAALAAEPEVLVVDSITPEWDGDGGILALVDASAAKGLARWQEPTHLHNKFVAKLVGQEGCHVIATVRQKTEYAQEMVNGRAVITKLGLQPRQRDGVEYEFDSVVSLDLEHRLAVVKDRTGVWGKYAGSPLTMDVAAELLEWSGSGAESPAAVRAALLADIAACGRAEADAERREWLGELYRRVRGGLDAAAGRLELEAGLLG